MTVFAFDVDGTLEVNQGPIKLETLRKLREYAYVFIVGNYGKLAQTTTEFADGNPRGLSKVEALKQVGSRFAPQEEKVYVADTQADEQAAKSAGWKFCYAKDLVKLLTDMKET